jgi:hypothetical protein
MDYNKCLCGHDWSKHLNNDKLSWCVHNQQICDCWGFEPVKVENHEFFDLKIER